MTSIPSSPADPSGDVPIFPAAEFPAQVRHARLLGLYPQRQNGLYMQRVRIPGGILSADQWRALGQIARRFTPATPLHLTTRQDVELHDLSAGDVPGVQQALSQVGLTSLGSGGDTLRNITVCPCSAGGWSGAPDLLPLARAIGQALSEYEGLFSLPRKFKLSLSGCAEACGRPFVHDLAFVAVRRGDCWGLTAIGAGSLGPKPATGIVLVDWIEPGEAVPLTLAAVRLFNRLGDRQNRAKARLRHVRQRLGDEAFLAELRREFAAVRDERAWPAITLSSPTGARSQRRVLSFPNGDLSAEALDALADVSSAGAALRIAADHRIVLFAEDATAIERGLAEHPVLLAAARPQVNVIACPGTRWCAPALADTQDLANRIRGALAGEAAPDTMIAISGCPNGCAHSSVADIGIIGGKSTVGGQTVEKYTILAGGGKGATAALARPVASGLSAQDCVTEAARLARALHA